MGMGTATAVSAMGMATGIRLKTLLWIGWIKELKHQTGG